MTAAVAVSARKRVAFVTNMPTPYREPIMALVAAERDIELLAIYCAAREPDRHWSMQREEYRRVFLKERYVASGGGYLHVNFDVWHELRQFRPDVVVTTAFQPTFLIAHCYARCFGARHIAMTDGTLATERALGALHRCVRRLVFRHTQAFIGPGKASAALYRSYGVPAQRIFQSQLCADNPRFAASAPRPPDIDLLYCGRFSRVKNVPFAIDVAAAVARKLGRRVSLALVGSGEQEQLLRANAAACSELVDVSFPGFAGPEALPAWYARARLLLLPSHSEAWGVVVNEAFASGVPALISSAAGAADDLVIDGANGFVLPLDVAQWADAAARLLEDEPRRARMGVAARHAVARFTYAAGARGIVAAVRHALDAPVDA